MAVPFIELPDHKLLRMRLEHTWHLQHGLLVSGMFGVGKSFGVGSILNGIQAACLATAGAAAASRWCHVQMAAETSPKAALVSVLSALAGSKHGINYYKSMTVLQVADRVVNECRDGAVSVLVIDEADRLSKDQFYELLQVPDRARMAGWPLGLVVIGTDRVRQVAVETGQFGQRIAAEHHMVRLTGAQVEEALVRLLPATTAVQAAGHWQSADGREHTWPSLCKRIDLHCNGLWRPLTTLLTTAQEVVRRKPSTHVADAVLLALTAVLSPTRGVAQGG